jgi:hypothetical protein
LHGSSRATLAVLRRKIVSWFRSVFGRKQSGSALSPANSNYLKQQRGKNQDLISILRRCRTREQVIEGLLKIGSGPYDEAPVAANAARQLQSNGSMDAFRVRDDFIRVLEAFLSSTGGL